MGLFSGFKDFVSTNINSAINDVKGAVGGLLGGGSGSASSASSASNYPQALMKVAAAWQSANKNAASGDLQKYLQSAAGIKAVNDVKLQMDGGANKDGSTISNYLNQLFGAVVTGAAAGVQNGVQQVIGNGINTVGEKLGASSQSQTLQQSVGQFLGGVMDGATSDWFKRNWPYIVFPVAGIIVLCYYIFRGSKNSNKGRARTKTKTRIRR